MQTGRVNVPCVCGGERHFNPTPSIILLFHRRRIYPPFRVVTELRGDFLARCENLRSLTSIEQRRIRKASNATISSSLRNLLFAQELRFRHYGESGY